MDNYSDMMVVERPADAPSIDMIDRFLILCTTPRTAGHFLCDLFSRQGWGRPAEYFNPAFAVAFTQRWIDPNPKKLADVLAVRDRFRTELLGRSVRNGMFSAKIFLRQFELFQAVVPSEKRFHVHTYRRNKRAQVISALVTLVTQRPFDSDRQFTFLPEVPRDTVTEALVEGIFMQICTAEAYWQAYFSKIDPTRWLSLAMEDIVADPDWAVETIASIFGLEALPGPEEIVLRTAPYSQDRALKAEFQERFGPLLDRLQAHYDRRA